MHIKHIKHNISGPVFKIPVNAEEFLKDVKQQTLPAVEPIDHDEWYDAQQMFEDIKSNELEN